MRCRFLVLLALLHTVPLSAQTGAIPADRPRARPPSALTGWADWEKGEELLKRITIPPAPVRTADEEAKTFKLAPGYRAELVACEPMVQCPIFFEFDPDGRIWVIEYQGYMRDVAGTGEGDPICRVVVLEDTDGDGRADKQTVFLDKLIMPRSFAFVKGGILLQEPPKLWFCEDTDGDLHCDKRTEAGTMGVGGNPQHTANGLRRGLDNWLHCADWPHRYQWRDGKLVDEPTLHRGQFGVSFDETGSFITCYESSAMRMDLLPADAVMRHPGLARLAQAGSGGAFGINVNVATEAQEVFPIRVTPAITLGALELRDDGRLRTYTIVSGTCFYDGDQFPPEMRGNVFVPESGGHLVGTLRLSGGIAPKATRFFPPEQEFIASTDERFRPVNARVGPEGALYLADMYHGIIEHVIFMVPWLTRQIAERKLYEGNDRGRIWRIVHEGTPLRKRPALGKAGTPELVAALGHANGWQRQTAQRLLTEKGGAQAAELLDNVVKNPKSAPLQLLHALWTLDGLGVLSVTHLTVASKDTDARVRAAAMRLLGDHHTTIGTARAVATLRAALQDADESVRLQAALAVSGSGAFEGWPALADYLTHNEGELHRVAVMTGLHGAETVMLDLLLDRADWADESMHRRETLRLLAQLTCLGEPATAVTARIGRTHGWQRDALVDGLLATQPSDPRQVKPVMLAQRPVFLDELAKEKDVASRERSQRLRLALTWPGAETVAQTPRRQPLSEAAQKQIERGAAVYQTVCGLCHMPTGTGVPGVAPPLAGSAWATGEPERLVRIALHGLYGPVEVNGQTWSLAMPGQGENPLLDDAKLADILSHIRNTWGNEASLITADQVAAVRAQTKERKIPWTADTLMQVDLGPGKAGRAVQPEADGSLTLPASAAKTYGQKLAYRPSLDVLAPWRIATDMAEWLVQVPADGEYEVRVTLAADDASAGDKFCVEAEGSRAIGTVVSSGGYDRFVDAPAGPLTLQAGINRLLLRPEGPLVQELADVRAVKLKRVK